MTNFSDQVPSREFEIELPGDFLKIVRVYQTGTHVTVTSLIGSDEGVVVSSGTEDFEAPHGVSLRVEGSQVVAKVRGRWGLFGSRYRF